MFHRLGLEPRQKALRRKYWVWFIVWVVVLGGLGIRGPLNPDSHSLEGPNTWGEYFFLMAPLIFILVMRFLPPVSRKYLTDDRRLVAGFAGVHRFTATSKGLVMRHSGVEELVEWGRIRRVEVDGQCLVLSAGPGEVLVLLRARVLEGDFNCFAATVQQRVREGNTFTR